MEATGSYLLSNVTKINQFKAKDSKIKPYLLCLGTLSKDFTINKMKLSRLNGHVYGSSVDYNIIDINDILDICKSLIA